MFFTFFFLIILVVFTTAFPIEIAPKKDSHDNAKITILYDNYVYKEGTKPNWGFSCLKLFVSLLVSSFINSFKTRLDNFALTSEC